MLSLSTLLEYTHVTIQECEPGSSAYHVIGHHRSGRPHILDTVPCERTAMQRAGNLLSRIRRARQAARQKGTPCLPFRDEYSPSILPLDPTTPPTDTVSSSKPTADHTPPRH